MNKKVVIFAGLCALGLCTWEVQAVNSNHVSILSMEVNDNVPTGYEVIFLKGDLMFGVAPNAIVAGANENSVYLHFNQSFGNVDIKIYNAAGNLIHNRVVDTSMQQTVIISIFGTTSGTYTVVLNNANGYAEGDFDKN